MIRRFVRLALLATSVALVATGTVRAAPTTYADPTGDNGAAADIGAVNVEVRSDGLVSLTSTIANTPTIGSEGLVFAALDTDLNPQTGALFGGDYVVLFSFGDLSAEFVRWDGSAYVDATGNVTSIVGGGSVEFRIDPAALGGKTTFDFTVAATTGPVEARQIDVAPDSGSWHFEVKAPLVAEEIDAKFVPAAPKAGTVFQPTVVRVKLSDGSYVIAASYHCVATLGGKLLRGTGRGGCTFKLPKNAKGKRLLVTLFVPYGGTTDEYDPYVFKVR